MANKIILRRDTAANWTSVDPVLSNGEIGLETDTGRFKIGNGVTTWEGRPYYANADYIAAEYTGALLAAVEDAEDQVALAAAQVDLAAAQKTLAIAEKVAAANAATNAGASASSAQASATAAAASAAEASALDDAAIELVLDDDGSDTRLALNELYVVRETAANREASYVVARSPSTKWPVGWTEMAEANGGLLTVQDDADFINVDLEAGCVIQFEDNLSGDEDLRPVVVTVEMILDDYASNLNYPDGSLWGLGWVLNSTPLTTQMNQGEYHTVNMDIKTDAMSFYQPVPTITRTFVLTQYKKVLHLFAYSGADGGSDRQWRMQITAARML